VVYEKLCDKFSEDYIKMLVRKYREFRHNAAKNPDIQSFDESAKMKRIGNYIYENLHQLYRDEYLKAVEGTAAQIAENLTGIAMPEKSTNLPPPTNQGRLEDTSIFESGKSFPGVVKNALLVVHE
jgi:hypothetical protein